MNATSGHSIPPASPKHFPFWTIGAIATATLTTLVGAAILFATPDQEQKTPQAHTARNSDYARQESLKKAAEAAEIAARETAEAKNAKMEELRAAEAAITYDRLRAEQQKVNSTQRMKIIQKQLDAGAVQKVAWEDHTVWINRSFYRVSSDEKAWLAEVIFSESKHRDRKTENFKFKDATSGEEIATYDPYWGFKMKSKQPDHSRENAESDKS